MRVLVKVAAATIVFAAALGLSTRAANADCGRSAANAARPTFRDVEAHPPKNVDQAHVAFNKLMPFNLQPCPDENGPARDADFAVFYAWRTALNARALEYIVTSWTPEPRCAPLRRAEHLAALVQAYRRVYTVGFASTKASPDATHVAHLLHHDGLSVGFTFPPPYTVAQIQPSRALAPDSVRAHLPTGVSCPI